MKKRIIAWLLCLVTLLAVLPAGVSAQELDVKEEEVQEEHPEAEAIRALITKNYWRTVRASGVSNLAGYCGLMAGWELYFMGITKHPLTYNGNDMYNVFSAMDVTDKGYDVKSYPASQYNLEEALNAVTHNGTVDAYNIMVGYQWTHTAAGRKYGHVLVIYAILDGMVYFTEGFPTRFGKNPSQAMVASIADFAEFYDGWTRFEGLCHFGRKDYTDFCEYYGTNLFVSVENMVSTKREPSSDPTLNLRILTPGERLHATGIYVNPDGEIFYQVDDCGTVSFVSAQDVKPAQFTTEDVAVSDLEIPQLVEQGKDILLSGSITSDLHELVGLSVEIINDQGEKVYTYQLDKRGYMIDLGSKQINAQVDIRSLKEGVYLFNVYCATPNYYVAEGQVIGQVETVLVDSQVMTVGGDEPGIYPLDQEVQTQLPQDGWHYQDGKWFYYENGAARTGWVCDNGIDYYLQEDGSAATGWLEVNGKLRYFSTTGAMRTGWLNTEEGTFYMLINGEAAKGLRQIGMSLYCFDSEGQLMKNCYVTEGDSGFYVNSSGVVSSFN